MAHLMREFECGKCHQLFTDAEAPSGQTEVIHLLRTDEHGEDVECLGTGVLMGWFTIGPSDDQLRRCVDCGDLFEIRTIHDRRCSPCNVVKHFG